jgi:E3 ubiquitin-protein ligase MGRN1
LIDNDSTECVICMTDPKEVAVYPCRHMCMCLTCAEALPSQNNKCPMCRRPALLLLR